MGRLAILLYGHMRTYKRTYKNFFDNIVNVNKRDGWEIDIFIHSWDVWNITDENVWHKHQNCFPTMSGKKLTQQDKQEIVETYKPVKFAIDGDNMPRGRYESVKRVNLLREEYQKSHNVSYDYFLTTRPDLLFLKPLRLNEYLHLYDVQLNLKSVGGMPKRVNFCSAWHFRYPLNLPVLDMRFPNESDLLWFSNYCSYSMQPLVAYKDKEALNVFIRYRFNMEFIQIRETTDKIEWNILISNSEFEQFKNQSIELKSHISKLDNASIRIHSHLAYKLGSAMILNSKSLWGYIRMPYVLSYIKESHREEQRKYQARIAKNPSLKLPKLESYPDYKEAIKEKQCFTYKLGEALIKANNVRGGGRIFAYLRFFQEVRELKREFRERKK